MSKAIFEAPKNDTEEIKIGDITLNVSGALTGQTLIYNEDSKSFIPGTANGTVSGTFNSLELAYADGNSSLTSSPKLFFDPFSDILHVDGDIVTSSNLRFKQDNYSASIRFNYDKNRIEFCENSTTWLPIHSSIHESKVLNSSNNAILFVENDTLAQNTKFIWNNDRQYLGINTENPSYSLDVNGIARFTSHIIVDGYTINLNNASLNQVLAFDGNYFCPKTLNMLNGTLNTNHIPYANDVSSLTNSDMIWDKDNKKLTINTSSIGNGGISIVDERQQNVGLFLQYGNAQIGTSNATLSFFAGNKAPQMTLTSHGFLGLGMVPNFKLDVIGDAHITNRILLDASLSDVSPSRMGAFRFNTNENRLEFSENGNSWLPLNSQEMFIDIVEIAANTEKTNYISGNKNVGIEFYLTKRCNLTGVKIFYAGNTVCTIRCNLWNMTTQNVIDYIDINVQAQGIYHAIFSTHQPLLPFIHYAITQWEIGGTHYSAFIEDNNKILPNSCPLIAAKYLVFLSMSKYASDNNLPILEDNTEKYPIIPMYTVS